MHNASPAMASTLLVSIVAGALISEDAATASAATLAAVGLLPVPLAFTAALAGIWIGDCALFALARTYGGQLAEKRWARSWLKSPLSGPVGAWFRRRGAVAVMLSRLFPGTRLPISLAAGFAKMPAVRFAVAAALGAAAWITAAFYLVRVGGLRLGSSPRATLALSLAFAACAMVLPRVLPSVIRMARRRLQRWSQWEFWPAWLFYAPVTMMCAWLALRYRGLSLPACANPAQRNGGLIGESKIEVLRELMRVAPENVAGAYLVPPAPLEARLARLRVVVEMHDLGLPFVLKPDVAQRGEGFKKITRMEEAVEYLREVTGPVIAQRYAPGPCEAGIFYYRFPHEKRGHILAITDKQFPVVIGDGRHTLEELIRADARAALIAGTYLRRFADLRNRVIPAGVPIRLVEAGNHCQGCIFRDGSYLYSEALLDRIDEISRSLPGFFIGRYDIRYGSDDELRAGRGFTIVELNGAASEATSIYDARNSLWSAYRTLYRQWQLVYQIGAANRAQGQAAPGVLALFSDWLRYRRNAIAYPQAD